MTAETNNGLGEIMESDAENTMSTESVVLSKSVSLRDASKSVNDKGLNTDPDQTVVYSSPVEHYRTYKRRWLGITCLGLMNFVISWGWLSFAAISGDVETYFDLGDLGPVNWLSIVIMFAYLVSSPFVWWLLERSNIRVAIIIGASLTIVGSWSRYAGTKTKTFGAVMFGQILIGFAQPFALSTPTYYTDLWFTSRSRVTANAIATLSNALGAAVGELIGPGMVSKPSDIPQFILVTSIVATCCSLACCFIPAKPELPPCPSAEIVKLHWRDGIKHLATNKRFITIFMQFSIYVGFFNAYSTFTNQIMGPYGYSTDEAGIAGALLIFVGIVFSIITSIITDRIHKYRLFILLFVPFIAACYIAAIFMCKKDADISGPYAVSSVLGALSFSLLPIFLEWSQEQVVNVNPAVTASIEWMGGQLLGGIFIIIMNALRYPDDKGDPPGNMKKALIFEAVVACVGALPLVILKDKMPNNRVEMDSAANRKDVEMNTYNQE